MFFFTIFFLNEHKLYCQLELVRTSTMSNAILDIRTNIKFPLLHCSSGHCSSIIVTAESIIKRNQEKKMPQINHIHFKNDRFE